jgi:hypothetical protein
MPVQQSSTAVGSVSKSLTFFPHRPVEEGRNRGVATLTLITTGTSGAATTSNCNTTVDRSNLSVGLTVNITASGGVATAIAINAGGTGYRAGQTFTVVGSNGTTKVTGRIDQINSIGAATSIVLIGTGTASVTTQTGLATFATNTGPNGLQVNVTAAGGVVTAAVPATGREGAGYRIGDIVTIAGTSASTAVTASVASLTG